MRFASNLDGPFNFNLGFYHNHDRNDAHYYVNADTLDYAAVVLGGATVANGFDLYPSQYDNDNNNYTLSSNSIFGEVYYQAIPDSLKFTVRRALFRRHEDLQIRSGAVQFGDPGIGTSELQLARCCRRRRMPRAVAAARHRHPGGLPCFSNQNTSFKEWTGRAVVDWTPKVDFTDATHIYASYSRGVRDGGFNPPPLNPGSFPLTFAPETLDAYEVGAKNTLLGGKLQANITAWYYQYSGLPDVRDHRPHVDQSEHQLEALGRGRRVLLGGDRQAGSST